MYHITQSKTPVRSKSISSAISQFSGCYRLFYAKIAVYACCDKNGSCKVKKKKLTCIFWTLSALGHMSKAAAALRYFPVSPLTTTKDKRQAHATAVKWVPSLGTELSGPWEVARSRSKSNNGPVMSEGSAFRPSGDWPGNRFALKEAIWNLSEVFQKLLLLKDLEAKNVPNNVQKCTFPKRLITECFS